MVLFVYEPLLFEHGLRGNNMEAPLFLCYCGGIYHYLAWATADEPRRGAGTSSAVALYFFLGFMTKFVAALFLPVMLGRADAAAAGSRGRRLVADFGCGWRLAALVVALVVAVVHLPALRVGRRGVEHHVRHARADPLHGVPGCRRTSIPGTTTGVTIWNELVHMGTAWLAVGRRALLAWRRGANGGSMR